LILLEAPAPGDAGGVHVKRGKKAGRAGRAAFLARLKGKGQYGKGENELSFYPNFCGDLML
jgi:hypothetical protein